MPNDAKLGLVLGVGLVIAIGVVYFRKEPVAAAPTAKDSAATAVRSAGAAPVGVPRGQYRPARGKTVTRESSVIPEQSGERQPAQGSESAP